MFTDFERSRHCGQTRTRGSEDAGEIGVLGRERDRGVKSFLLVVVSIDGVDELDVRIFLDLVLERFDPQILIRGGRLGGNDRNLALGIRPHLSDQQLRPEAADRIARRLIDKEWPAAGRVSVEGHDLDAKLLRTLHCRNDSVRIARRDRNGGHMAFGEAVDDVDLRFCARFGGAVIGDFASGLLRRDFRGGAPSVPGAPDRQKGSALVGAALTRLASSLRLTSAELSVGSKASRVGTAAVSRDPIA